MSFGVGTLFPRRAVLVKLGALLTWISIVFLVDVVDHGGTWFTYWNPTSYGIVRVNVDSFLQAYLVAVSGVAEAGQRMAIGLQLQQRQPDLWHRGDSRAHAVVVSSGGLVARHRVQGN